MQEGGRVGQDVDRQRQRCFGRDGVFVDRPEVVRVAVVERPERAMPAEMAVEQGAAVVAFDPAGEVGAAGRALALFVKRVGAEMRRVGIGRVQRKRAVHHGHRVVEPPGLAERLSVDAEHPPVVAERIVEPRGIGQLQAFAPGLSRGADQAEDVGAGLRDQHVAGPCGAVGEGGVARLRRAARDQMGEDGEVRGLALGKRCGAGHRIGERRAGAGHVGGVHGGAGQPDMGQREARVGFDGGGEGLGRTKGGGEDVVDPGDIGVAGAGAFGGKRQSVAVGVHGSVPPVGLVPGRPLSGSLAGKTRVWRTRAAAIPAGEVIH